MSYLHNLPSIKMNKEVKKEKKLGHFSAHYSIKNIYGYAVSCHVYSVSTDFL